MRKRSWASAVALVAAALLGGCTGGGGDGDGEPALTIYVSLPLRSDAGRDAAAGARMALEAAGGEAAGIPVTAELMDGAPAGEPRWTPAQAAANARTATQDSTAIAYIGEFESGATRASLPVTNDARLLQVSPASAAEDLVAVPGTDDLPEAQPDVRTFGRVIPGDAEQAEAGAAWAESLGFDEIATAADRTEFGETMVSAFEGALVTASVVREDAGLLYYAGPAAERPAPADGERLMVTDAELVPRAAEAPAGTLATAAAQAPDLLPPAGRRFARDFAAEYGRRPGPYAAYGYEAMAVVLDSIDRAAEPTDRASVGDAFFATADRDSVLGTYSITEFGETTLDQMTGYEFSPPGRPRPVDAIEPR